MTSLSSDEYRQALIRQGESLLSGAKDGDFAKVRDAYARIGDLIPNRPVDDGPSELGARVSPRTARLLGWHGITTTEQVRSMSDVDLLRVPNLGRGTLNELRAAGLR